MTISIVYSLDQLLKIACIKKSRQGSRLAYCRSHPNILASNISRNSLGHTNQGRPGKQVTTLLNLHSASSSPIKTPRLTKVIFLHAVFSFSPFLSFKNLDLDLTIIFINIECLRPLTFFSPKHLNICPENVFF